MQHPTLPNMNSTLEVLAAAADQAQHTAALLARLARESDPDPEIILRVASILGETWSQIQIIASTRHRASDCKGIA